MPQRISIFDILKFVLYFEIFVLFFNIYNNYTRYDDSFLSSNNNLLEAFLLIIASIILSHLLLWRFLFDLKHKYRPIILKTIDFIWYLGAIISALLAANDLQNGIISRNLKEQIGRVDLYYSEMYELRDKANQACSEIVPATAEDNNLLDMDINSIKYICSNYNFYSDTLPEVDISGKCSFPSNKCQRDRDEKACDSIIKINERSTLYSVEGDKAIIAPERPLEAILSKDFKTNFLLKKNISILYNLCKKSKEYVDAVEYGNLLYKVKKNSYFLDRSNSHFWIYLLSIIIGLRVSRSTSEVYEAWRAVK